jgi:hypothetical protein
MSATPPPHIRHDAFRDALIMAVTEGQTPSPTCDLAPETRSVIEAIAEWHPEASSDLINGAYDAFERESDRSGWHVGGAPPNC